jgi:hypothetical protein
MISCAIGAKFQAGFLSQLPEPLTRSKMIFTERGTVHATVNGRANLSQLIECSQHSICIDA